MTTETDSPALIDAVPDARTEADTEAARAARIAAQNDAFRRALAPGGEPCPLPGRLVVTRGVAAHGHAFLRAAVRAVATDATFTEDNDPEGDHGFGTVEVAGVRVWWRIDLYDADHDLGSERAHDPAATARVLTILLPEEW